MMNFLCLLFEIMSRYRSIEWVSAVKMGFSIRRASLRIVLFTTAAHVVLLLSVDGRDGIQEYCGISPEKCWDRFLFWGVHLVRRSH